MNSKIRINLHNVMQTLVAIIQPTRKVPPIRVTSEVLVLMSMASSKKQTKMYCKTKHETAFMDLATVPGNLLEFPIPVCGSNTTACIRSNDIFCRSRKPQWKTLTFFKKYSMRKPSFLVHHPVIVSI